MPPPLTNRQLNVLDVTSRIKMAWVALWFALGLFAITLIAFLTALFYFKADPTATSIIGAINALLGVNLGRVYWNLFPSRKSTSGGGADVTGRRSE